jgi:hypothetical protein
MYAPPFLYFRYVPGSCLWSDAALSHYRAQCGLRSLKSYQDDAAALIRSSKSNIIPAVLNYVLGGLHADAAKLAVGELEGMPQLLLCRRSSCCTDDSVGFLFASVVHSTILGLASRVQAVRVPGLCACTHAGCRVSVLRYLS